MADQIALNVAKEEIEKLRKELKEAKAEKPPMAKIIAAQEESNRQRARAEQAEGRNQTLARDLEAALAREQKLKQEAAEANALLKEQDSTIFKLTAELEELRAFWSHVQEEVAAMEAAEAGEKAPVFPGLKQEEELSAEDLEALRLLQEEAAKPAAAGGMNKRQRQQAKKAAAAAPAQPAAKPAAAQAEALPAGFAPAAQKKASKLAAAQAAMARSTEEMAAAQERLAKRVAVLEEERRAQRELQAQKKRQEEEERREEEEAERQRLQTLAEDEAREARKLAERQQAEAEAAEKARRKELRRREQEELNKRIEQERKIYSKEDFEALQLLREEADQAQPDAEISPDELDEDEILEREMKRVQKEQKEKAAKSKAPTSFIDMMMKAEGMPMMDPEVVEQAQKLQKQKQRDELRKKLQAKRELEMILASPGAKVRR